MNALPFPQMKWALGGALRGFMGEGTLWRDAKPTHTGRTVVAALRAIHPASEAKSPKVTTP